MFEISRAFGFEIVRLFDSADASVLYKDQGQQVLCCLPQIRMNSAVAPFLTSFQLLTEESAPPCRYPLSLSAHTYLQLDDAKKVPFSNT